LILLLFKQLLKATFWKTLLFESLEVASLKGLRFNGVMALMNRTADLELSPNVRREDRFERKIMVTSCGPE